MLNGLPSRESDLEGERSPRGDVPSRPRRALLSFHMGFGKRRAVPGVRNGAGLAPAPSPKCDDCPAWCPMGIALKLKLEHALLYICYKNSKGTRACGIEREVTVFDDWPPAAQRSLLKQPARLPVSCVALQGQRTRPRKRVCVRVHAPFQHTPMQAR